MLYGKFCCLPRTCLCTQLTHFVIYDSRFPPRATTRKLLMQMCVCVCVSLRSAATFA